MQKRNNTLVLLAAILLTFLCTIWLQWGLAREPAYSFLFTAAYGSIHLFFDLPIWFLVFLSGIAVGISATNIAGWTTISKGVPVVLLLFSGFHYVASAFCCKAITSTSMIAAGAGVDPFAVGVGPFVALLATVVAMAITLRYDSRNANA